jgi:hypothetical protein
MRAETLSRALSGLRALGALSAGRKICVLDAERLNRIAEGETVTHGGSFAKSASKTP